MGAASSTSRRPDLPLRTRGHAYTVCMLHTSDTVSALLRIFSACRTPIMAGAATPPMHQFCGDHHNDRIAHAPCNAMATKLFIAATLWVIASAVCAQPKVLLEACNAIDDRARRMECLEEVMQRATAKHDVKDAQTAALKRTKAAFAAFASTVQSGISYNNYSVLVLEPAKELGILRQEVPSLDPETFNKLSEAVTAYNDAGTVWRASIYQSQDAGLFGRIVDPDRTGLASIVRRYQLNTTTVLLSTHLPINAALSTIWRSAEMSARNAFEIADGVPQTVIKTRPVCDQWGNPKDEHGNPCTQD